METLDAGRRLSRITADFIPRNQREVAVEGGVLQPLGHGRARHLLEPAHKQFSFAAARLVQVRRLFQQQHAAQEVKGRRGTSRVVTLRDRRYPVYESPITIRDGPVTDVRPVDGEVGQDFPQRHAERVERQVAKTAMPLGDAIQPARQHLQFAGHRHPQDKHLRFVRDFVKLPSIVDEAAVDIPQVVEPGPADEQACQTVEEVVACCAGDGPVRGQRLLRAEDLLDDDVQGPRHSADRRRSRRRKERRRDRRFRHCGQRSDERRGGEQLRRIRTT